MTEVSSVGPVTATFAFRSWVLVECEGESVQRRIDSEEALGRALAELGVPSRETGSVAARLWDARPQDARFSTARPWETFWAMQGMSLGWFLAWTVVFFAVFVGLVLLAWLTD